MKPKMVVLTGPTAVGKSGLSVNLAKKIGAEIISADSMQVYRGMDIGTAKIKQEEMGGVPHYLIDVLDFTEGYDAFSFKEMAKPIAKDIISRGKIPLIVGGTGFYIQALCFDIDFSENIPKEITDNLYKELESKGRDALHKRLLKVDTEYAKLTHKNNVKRVIHALAFYEAFGEKLSSHNKMQLKKKSPYDLYYFVLTKDRAALYESINKRVDEMINEGLIEEVKSLARNGLKPGTTAGAAIGYAEIMEYLDGKITLPRALELIKQNTRHYAKRQLTWFKRERESVFINKDEFKNDEEIISFIEGKINEGN